MFFAPRREHVPVNLDDIQTLEEQYADLKREGKVVHVERPLEIPGDLPINHALNEKISLWRGDITR